VAKLQCKKKKKALKFPCKVQELTRESASSQKGSPKYQLKTKEALIHLAEEFNWGVMLNLLFSLQIRFLYELKQCTQSIKFSTQKKIMGRENQ